jgi:hypothetical protein
VPAKLAVRVRVLSVGHGRKSDPDDAVSVTVACTQTINRLHRLLMDLVPGGARRNLSANRATALLAGVTPAGAPTVTRWQLATELAEDVRGLEQRIAAVEARITAADQDDLAAAGSAADLPVAVYPVISRQHGPTQLQVMPWAQFRPVAATRAAPGGG